MNYLKRFIREPEGLEDKHYIYDYKTIKNFQKNSGLKDFAVTLYLALIAEIVFLYLSLRYNEEYKNDELILSLLALTNYINLNNIDFFIKIFYLPVALTTAFIIFRSKNYLLYELPLDIDTKIDKMFELLIPLIFSIIVYFIFNIHYYKYWFLLSSVCFFITSIVSYLKLFSIKRHNKYRIPIPKRSAERKYYKDNNKWGFRWQLFRWSNWLVIWWFLTFVVGILMCFLNINILFFVNYIVGIMTCSVIHNFTFLSKSVQPVCIEAYEKEIEEVINSMSYSSDSSAKAPIKKWELLKLQIRSYQHLKKKDVNEKKLKSWFTDISKVIENQ